MKLCKRTRLIGNLRVNLVILFLSVLPGKDEQLVFKGAGWLLKVAIVFVSLLNMISHLIKVWGSVGIMLLLKLESHDVNVPELKRVMISKTRHHWGINCCNQCCGLLSSESCLNCIGDMESSNSYTLAQISTNVYGCKAVVIKILLILIYWRILSPIKPFIFWFGSHIFKFLFWIRWKYLAIFVA